MISYGIDRDWTLGLRELIRRYGVLRAAPRGAERRRGQDFNTLIADVLRHWGIEDAQANVRGIDGRDEIDVSFSLAGTHYMLEAKWEAKPQSADPVIKLAGRVGQRLGGTRGIVLSMSGYTRHAAPAVERGRQPEVLLLDRSHFEAMLSGLMSADGLLQALVQQASRHGGVHVPLTDVLFSRQVADPPTFARLPDAEPPWQTVVETAGGISARPVLLSNTEWPEPSGLGVGERADTLLVTTPEGIIEVDVAQGTSRWALPLPGSRATPIIAPDGSLLSLCNYAVVRWSKDELAVIGGGFTGNSNLLAGPDGPAWVFDNTGADYDGLLTLTAVGELLGDQQQHEIDFPANVWNATWLEHRRFFLVGDGHSGTIDLNASRRISPETWIESPQSGPRPILARDPTTVITAAYDQRVRASLYQTNVISGSHTRLALLQVNRSVQGPTAIVNGNAYLLADVRGNDIERPRPILMHLSGLGPFAAPAARGCRGS